MNHSPQRLLHQQCWCWGQDIRREAGNLLLEFGFGRQRPPEGVAGSSAYRIAISGGWIQLWGFGLLCFQGGEAVYIHRYRFEPAVVDLSATPDEVWTPNELILTGDCNWWIGAVAMRWIASYERWVLREFGLRYRRSTLWDWHEPAVLPEHVPEEWEALHSTMLAKLDW